jgi:hypothetical protein
LLLIYYHYGRRERERLTVFDNQTANKVETLKAGMKVQLEFFLFPPGGKRETADITILEDTPVTYTIIEGERVSFTLRPTYDQKEKFYGTVDTSLNVGQKNTLLKRELAWDYLEKNPDATCRLRERGIAPEDLLTLRFNARLDKPARVTTIRQDKCI